MKKIVLFFIFFLIGIVDVYAVKYESRLSTYYPSPFGNYEFVYLKPKVSPVSEPCNIGTIHFDPSGKLFVCQEDSYGTGRLNPPSVWEDDGYNVYSSDSNPYLFVGMGTSSPEFKLSLENDGGIFSKGTYGSGAVLSTGGPGTRLIWYPRKGAFRAGEVTNTQWNNGNIGNYSFATGYDTTASNTATTALGHGATASGLYSTSIGYETTALGEASTAFGYQTVASGLASTAFGYKTSATGDYSTSFGFETIAMGESSAAMGQGSIASGYTSIAIGRESEAIADYTLAIGDKSIASEINSIAMGFETHASAANAVTLGSLTEARSNYAFSMGYRSRADGQYSFAIGYSCLTEGDYSLAIGRSVRSTGDYSIGLGHYVEPQAYGSLAVGLYNIVEGDTRNWVETDALFVVGSGPTNIAPDNALTVLKNGNVGIGENHPTSSLSVSGIPEYADNAAALAGGLQLGSIYRTGDSLKIVH